MGDGREKFIPYPYIMDPPQVMKKLGREPLTDDKVKLKKIIEEFSKLLHHCHLARGHCAENVERILKGEDPIPYCDFS